MKIKLNTNLAVNLIVISIAIYIALPFFKMLNIHLGVTGNTNVYNSWQAQHIKPIDNVALDENLPHSQYVKLKDSVLTMRNLRSGNASLVNRGGLPFISITHSLACDTCSFKWYKEHAYLNTIYEHSQSYITLTGWTLNTRNYLGYVDEGKFYVENGQGYVRKTVLDTSIKRPDGSVYNKIHVADVPVKFRYNHVDGSLLIPVSNRGAHILAIIIRVTGVLFSLYVLYLISIFLKFAIDIFKGQTFTAKNIWRLQFIAFSLLGYPVIIYMLHYLMKFVFREYFIPGVILKSDVQIGSWEILGLVIIFLLSFRQGKKLKEEHDLTV